MINTVLPVLLLSLSSLLFSFSFITPVLAEDTRKDALYSGNVRLVAPMQEEEEFNMIDGFEKGMRELGISGGVGASLGYGDEGDTFLDEPRVYTFSLLPKMGWILGTYDRPRGALEFELEAFSSMVRVSNQFTDEEGITAMIGYNFETGTKWVPFVHGGSGIISSGVSSTGAREESGDRKKLLTSRLNAVGQIGVGLRYFIKERTSINAETRFRHVSNPTTSEDAGINSIFLLFGLSYFY
ncbi:MAG: acyloxyacyl hydrolase [Candidatus Brocadiales bacterium]